jgi:hypothetical protein
MNGFRRDCASCVRRCGKGPTVSFLLEFAIDCDIGAEGGRRHLRECTAAARKQYNTKNSSEHQHSSWTGSLNRRRTRQSIKVRVKLIELWWREDRGAMDLMEASLRVCRESPRQYIGMK